MVTAVPKGSALIVMKYVNNASVPKKPLANNNFRLLPTQDTFDLNIMPKQIIIETKQRKNTISIAGRWLSFLIKIFMSAK